jgi:RND family efflux transporter MFP subunit
MKPFSFFLFFLCVFTLSSCSQESIPETSLPLPQVKTLSLQAPVKKEFTVTGQVQAEKSATLSSEFRASIKNIEKKVGDKVKKGDLLLTLSSESVETTFKNAQSSYSLASQSVNQTDSSLIKNIESAQNSVDQAKIHLENTKKTNETATEQAKKALDTAILNASLSADQSETQLETAKKSLESLLIVTKNTESQAKNSLENAIQSSFPSALSALNTCDEILGVSPQYEHMNTSFKIYLGSMDSKSLKDAEDLLKNTRTLSQTSLETYEETLAFLQETEKTVNATRKVLEKSSTGSQFTETDLKSFISRVTGDLSTIRNMISSLQSAKKNLDSVLSSNASQIMQAEQGIKNAENALALTKQDQNGESQAILNARAQYNNTLSQLKSAEDSAQKQLESAQLALESMLKSADINKTSIRSNFTQIYAQYEQAKINYEKLFIQAPFDGTLSQIFITSGDEVSPGTPLIFIENTENFKITAYLSPEQIQGLSVGDTVKIGQKSSDIIYSLSKNVDSSLKKHQVEIIHKNQYLRSGQHISLSFFPQYTNTETTDIVIPLSALFVTETEKFVYTIQNNHTIEKKEVETGDIIGNNITLTSGISLSDTIIIEGGRNLLPGTQVEIIE